MANPVLRNGTATPYSIYQTYTADMTEGKFLPLGISGYLDDRVFKWTRFMDGTAITRGQVAQAAVPIAAHVSEAGTELTAGRTILDFTPGAADVAQDAYRDGYLKMEGGTLGIGQIFKLRSHPFKVASVATTFESFDPVVTTTTGNEILTLLKNPWADVIQSAAGLTAIPVGVPIANFTAVGTVAVPTAGYLQTAAATFTLARYGWLQTWGPASVLIDTADLVMSTQIGVSAAVAGSAKCVTLDGNAAASLPVVIGWAMEAIATNSIYASVFLTIAP